MDTILSDVFFPAWSSYISTVVSTTGYSRLVENLELWWNFFDARRALMWPAVRRGIVHVLDAITAALVPDSAASEQRSGMFSSDSLPGPFHPEATVDVTFKDVVEDYCTENDLFLVSLKKSHDKLGHPLYRVSSSPTGQSGVRCYFDEDVVWVESRPLSSIFEPISVESLAAHVK
jgi:hypothetical protein